MLEFSAGFALCCHPMKTQFFGDFSLVVVLSCAIGFSFLVSASCDDRLQPNFLLIIGDDCTYNDLPVYGGKNAKTPHLDQLAASGLVFDQAYLASAMCQPCRAELYTGLYPMNNGCAWNHAACKPEIKSLPHHLSKLGYRVGLAGKTHIKPKQVFPFETVSGFDPNCVRSPTKPTDYTGIKEFMMANDGKPFCLVIALVEPHVPWVMGDASQYPPDKIILPQNIADTKSTREHFSNYLAEITYMDSQVGKILKVLESTAKADDTLVLFTSEQGSQFPGCKWTNWNTGIHTGLIAAWPKMIRPGKRTSALVQYADITPTLVALAGGNTDSISFDGASFAEVLKGSRRDHRTYTYGMHNNVPEGPPYPIRSVSNGQYRLIRNLRPDELYIEKHLMGGGRLNNPYFSTWLGAQPEQTEVYNRVKRYMLRPGEQLYHTASDPYEMNNLAGSAAHREIQQQLSTELDRWLAEQKDPGIAMDSMETLQKARQLKHTY